jgi:hypothetical protein
MPDAVETSNTVGYPELKAAYTLFLPLGTKAVALPKAPMGPFATDLTLQENALSAGRANTVVKARLDTARAEGLRKPLLAERLAPSADFIAKPARSRRAHAKRGRLCVILRLGGLAALLETAETMRIIL